ncbi:hypothetical protein D9M69_642020 [compost metagenome]
MLRHTATITCAWSWHTPSSQSNASSAVVSTSVLPLRYCTLSATALARATRSATQGSSPRARAAINAGTVCMAHSAMRGCCSASGVERK